MCAASLALASAAYAQKDPGAADKKPLPAAGEPTVHLYKLGDLDDLDLKNGDKSLGDIDGLIIDASDGRIIFAMIGKGGVMGVGESEHLVPWESIHLTAKDLEKNEGVKANTTLTEEQIKSAPIYKKDEAIDAPTIRSIRENAKLASDSTWERAAANGLISSKELKGAHVSSTDDKDIGEIGEIVLAPDDGVVAYTVLDAGGMLGMGEKHIALPWSVLQTNYKDRKLTIKLPATKERIEKAPDYVSKDWKRMSSSGFIREMSTYWSKDPYWVRTTAASAGKR
jgi:sporulation protein YlmC with PRC-barrel domain